MARTKAISMLQAAGTNADLAEIYGIVIENIQKETLAGGLKSQLYTGDPATGSVEFKRFTNSASKIYGSAKSSGGENVTAKPVTVNLSTHREIIEEFARFDLDTFGVAGIMARRAVNHIDTLAAELDNAFFVEANSEAQSLEVESESAEGKLEEAIVKLETTKNDYTRGVPRNNMVVVASPSFYSEIRSKLDSLLTSNVDTAVEEFGMFHGVRVYSSIYIPDGTDFIVMANGSVAQPVVVYQYSEPEKIPQSNDFSVDLFFDYGTKAITEDLIFKVESSAVSLGEIDVTSKAGDTTNGNTKIDVDPASAGTGFKYVYKMGTKYESFKYDDDLSTWTDLTQNTNIASGASTHITVAKVTDDTEKARARGIARLVKYSG